MRSIGVIDKATKARNGRQRHGSHMNGLKALDDIDRAKASKRSENDQAHYRFHGWYFRMYALLDIVVALLVC
jgi:hypothetical protein